MIFMQLTMTTISSYILFLILNAIKAQLCHKVLCIVLLNSFHSLHTTLMTGETGKTEIVND